jgi:outer membrane protein TolC
VEDIAAGDLANALGRSATTRIRVQPVSTPESVARTVEQAISRALEQRRDFQAQVAQVHLAQAERQQAQASIYPTLDVSVITRKQSLYLLQQTLPWGRAADLTGSLAWSLN